MSDAVQAAVSTASPPPPPPLLLNPDDMLHRTTSTAFTHTVIKALEASSTPSFSFDRTTPPPSWCPTTHLVNDPSAEDTRPVRVEWKDSMVSSPSSMPQIRLRIPRHVSSTTSTMGNPKEEAATRSVSIADTDRRSVVLILPTPGTHQKASAVRREPADKVRLVDRGSADRQGKIYPNVHGPQPHQTYPRQPGGGSIPNCIDDADQLRKV